MTKKELIIFNETYSHSIELKDYYLDEYKKEDNKEKCKELEIIIKDFYGKIEVLRELKKAWRI